MRRYLACVCAVVFIGSCGKKTSSSTSPASGAPGAALFSLSELNATGTATTSSASDMLAQLNTESVLYDNEPNATGTATSTDPCQTQENTEKVQASKSTLTVAYTLDETACQNQQPPSDGTMYTAYTNAEFLQVTCAGGDLSTYNGAEAGTFSIPNLGTLCTSFTQLLELSVASSSTSGTLTDTTKELFYIGESNAIGPCTSTVTGDTAAVDNNCEAVLNSTLTTALSAGTATITPFGKFTFNNIVDSTDSTAVWHTSGTMGVTYDDWTGTVVYSGASTAPAYNLTSPISGNVTGTLTATADLQLTQGVPLQHASQALRRRLARLWPRLLAP